MSDERALKCTIGICIAVIVALTASVLWANRAECAWCYDVPCYSGSMCGGGCHCVKFGSDPTGICVSVDLVPPGGVVVDG